VNRLHASLLSLVVCGVVLSPIRQGFSSAPVDDFPLSWFPMFARARPAIETPVYVVAQDAAGTRQKVPQSYWTSGGFNQGATQLLTAARGGKDAVDPLCKRIAKKIGATRDPLYAEATEVRILRGRYSKETYFGEGDHTPERETVLVACPVPGGHTP
jgi:hypothetical protein